MYVHICIVKAIRIKPLFFANQIFKETYFIVDFGMPHTLSSLE